MAQFTHYVGSSRGGGSKGVAQVVSGVEGWVPSQEGVGRVHHDNDDTCMTP